MGLNFGCYSPWIADYNRHVVHDCSHLAQVSLGARLHQGHSGGEAQAIHVAARLHVVKAIQDQSEAAEEVDAKAALLYVSLNGGGWTDGRETGPYSEVDLWVVQI